MAEKPPGKRAAKSARNEEGDKDSSPTSPKCRKITRAQQKMEMRSDKALQRLCHRAEPAATEGTVELVEEESGSVLDESDYDTRCEKLWDTTQEQPQVAESAPREGSIEGSEDQGPQASTAAAQGTSQTGQLDMTQLTKLLLSMNELLQNQARPKRRHRGTPTPEDQEQESEVEVEEGSRDQSQTGEGESEEGMSSDEDPPKEHNPSDDMFPPNLFQSIRLKALAVADTGEDNPKEQEKQVPQKSTPHKARLFFKGKEEETDSMPPIPLFQRNLKRFLDQPDTGLAMSQNLKKYYSIDNSMSDLLVIPPVDEPIRAIHSNVAVPGEEEHVLKAEEKTLDQYINKIHQATAWSIKAAQIASFFTRACMVYIRDVQKYIPKTNKTLRQDILKIFNTSQFVADATMHSFNFSVKAMCATRRAKRFHWLKPWQADVRQKRRVAASPLDQTALFGKALDHLLIENSAKKKVMPSGNRRGTMKAPVFHKKPFRRSDLGSQNFRSSGQSLYKGKFSDKGHNYTHKPYQRQQRGGFQAKRSGRGRW